MIRKTLEKIMFPKILAILATILATISIGGALLSQYVFGLQPCAMCLEQRVPYYTTLPILVTTLVLWNIMPIKLRSVILSLVAIIFAYGAYLGAFHSGVEWGFWPGPTTCTGIGSSFSMDDIASMKPVISCDKVQFRFLGISLAGFNAMVSIIIAFLAATAVWVRNRANQSPGSSN